MLNSLRESSGSWVVKILLGLLVLSFAIWGIGDIVRFQPDANVATVGDQGVSGQQFLARFDQQVRNLQRQFGPTFDQEQARRLGFVDQVLQQMVTQMLYDQQAADMNLIATDEEALRNIQQNPAFRDSLGNFSRLTFENRLANARETEQSYVALLKQAIKRNQLLEASTLAARSPSVLVDAIYRYQNEKRVLEILSVQVEAMQVAEQPSEDAINNHYREHEADFMAPEYRDISYLTLSADDVAGDMKVNEDELHAAYDARLSEFTETEVRTVDQVVVPDQELAERIVGRMREGGDFYAVAKELADADRDAVSMGEMTRDQMPDAIGEPVFALGVGEIGGPVQSPFGWHVFRVTDISPGGKKEFAEVRDILLNDLQREKAVDAMYDLSNRIEDRLAGGARLEEIAETLNLTHGRVSTVDASGRNRDDQPADGLPNVAGLIATAFNSEVGEDLALHESADGTYYLVRVDKIYPPTLQPLNKVRDVIIAELLTEEKNRQAEEEANRLLAEVQSGKDLTDLASGGGISVQTTPPVVRSQSLSQANLSGDLASKVYDLAPGTAASGPSRDGSAHLVVRVKEIEPASADDNAPGRSQTRQAITQSISEDLLQQFTAALRQKFEVEIHDRQIDALFDEVNARG